MSSPVVVFAPYSIIWSHSFAEALVAASIKAADTEIVYVTCDGMMNEACVGMSAHRMNHQTTLEKRLSLCSACKRRRDAISENLGSVFVDMENLLPPSLKDELATFASKIQVNDIMTLEVDGFKVGRIAMHETILHYKLTSLSEMTDEAIIDFRIRLTHVLLSLRVTQSLIKKYAPSRIITYNTHLSTNYMMMLVAEEAGIPTFGLHAGGNMAKRTSSLYVFRRDMVDLYQNWISRFERELGAIPTTRSGISDAALHFKALTSGKTVWVYSSPKDKRYFDVRRHYGIESNQKILLAMLSSYDELFSSQMMGVMSAPPMMFKDQLEWVRALVDYTSKRTDLFLIVRVHPRELPNLRDDIHSTHAKQLMESLTDLPPNVCVNWPQEKISLYDLIPHVSVGLNGWSSTGKELAFLGIPVVLFTDEILYYPSSLNLLAKSRDDYFRMIDDAIQDGWSFERIRRTFRWLAVEYSLGTVDISDRFSRDDGLRSVRKRVVNALQRKLMYRFEARKLRRPALHSTDFVKIVLEDEAVIDLNSVREGRLSGEQEDALIRAQLREIVGTIFGQVPPGASLSIESLRSATR